MCLTPYGARQASEAGTIEFKVSGRVINIVPKPLKVEENYSPRTVTQNIEGAKKHSMSPADLRAERERLMKYGARQAKKVDSKERDIPRVIQESRSRRRTS